MNKLKPIILALILSFSIFQVKSQTDPTKAITRLAADAKNWFEGFQKNIGANEFSYNSFRKDVGKSLITRCTDGQMAIEWETQTIASGFDKPEAGFLWIAALDLTKKKLLFDVYINGQKRFEIPSSTEKNWQLKTNDGGTLSFTTVEMDQHGDAHGYMSLVVPAQWLKKGTGQTIKIVGRANDDSIYSTWIIVYQTNDALAYLRNSMEYDVWMELEMDETKHGFQCNVNAPAHLSGSEIMYSVSGKTKKTMLTEAGDYAVAMFQLPASAKNKPFKLNDAKGEVFVIESMGIPMKTTRLLAKALLVNECVAEGTKLKLTARRIYEPNTVSSLMNLANSTLGKGRIYLMNSSHQDIAWMDSPEKCVIDRDTMLLAPMFEMAQKNKNYRFDVEDALMLREFISRHPEKKPLVKEMLTDGRISCGSTFIQPYEEMYSGESLARQFYLGTKWLKDEFGYQATVYWNEDIPGRSLQMPQLMRKAGTKYMMISRHEQGLYDWHSPDGSFVTTFSPGHYGYAYTALHKSFHEAAQFIATNLPYLGKYYPSENASPVMPLLSDWDMSPAVDYSDIINKWENIKELQNEQGQYVPINLPRFKVASAPEFFDALIASKPVIPSIRGERPNVWLYIHGPSHHQAIKASREGDILLTMAEKLATVNALVDGSFGNYPEDRLNKAWEAKIFPDHGWGGKHGDITDALFLQKYEYAKAEAQGIVNENMKGLSTKIKTDAEKGRAVVVFNSLNWQRNDPVSIDVNFDKAEAFGLELSDASGNKTMVQVKVKGQFADGSIKKACIQFLANVPSIGYSTYYLKTLQKKNTEPVPAYKNEFENQYYKLRFADGGLSSIFDKTLNKELVDTTKFKAGEVFTMRSIGNGAGEFSDIQKPDMNGFDKTGNYQTKWELEENGPVFTTFKYRQKIRYAVVEQRVKVFHHQKRIDFETALLNWEGVLYREFRMALPLNMTNGQVAYEVPYGVVEVGKDELEGAAGERYNTPCKDVHPRGIENWISASNVEFGVTMSSSVAVADYIDPTDQPVANQMLQPLLIASRKSCHDEGNEYLQTGNHSFRFSITSHQPGWINGAAFGSQANEQLQAVWADHQLMNASLPESQSFYKTIAPNVLVTAIKKAEDSDDVILRIVEMEGKDKTINIESFINLKNAEQTNLIEETIKPLPVKGNSVQLPLGHHAIETIKLHSK